MELSVSFLSLSDGVPASSLGSRLLYTRSLLAMLSFPGSGGEWQVQEWAEGEDELQPCNLALSQPPGALPGSAFRVGQRLGVSTPSSRHWRQLLLEEGVTLDILSLFSPGQVLERDSTEGCGKQRFQ